MTTLWNLHLVCETWHCSVFELLNNQNGGSWYWYNAGLLIHAVEGGLATPLTKA
jgi:hypothetical protein